MSFPKLAIVIPCYNEEKVFEQSLSLFKSKLNHLIEGGLISAESFLLYVNDGSKDQTWDLIVNASHSTPRVRGICLSRNRGHQNALLAGMTEVVEQADIVVTADCDGQDDVDAIDGMVEKYRTQKCQIVYGVRNSRKTDSFFKKTTALLFYRLMSFLGAEVVYNHADFRLVSSQALRNLLEFHEVNLFLRGLFPLIGYKSDVVYYERFERQAGETHYPFTKMLSFALDGITSFSVKPLRFIFLFGALTVIVAFILLGWLISSWLFGCKAPSGLCLIVVSGFLGGVQLLSIGVLGEYIGKIYMETKARPRFIVSDRC